MIAEVGGTTSESNKTSATSWQTSYGMAQLYYGRMRVAILASDNIGTVDGATNNHRSVDDDGIPMTKLCEYSLTKGAARAGVTLSVWMIATVPDTGFPFSGGYFNITFSGAVIAKAITVRDFAFDPATYIDVGEIAVRFDPDGDPGPLTLNGASGRRNLFIRAMAAEANIANFTPDGSMTTFPTNAGYTSGGVSDSNVAAHGEYQIANQASLATDPTSTGVVDWLSIGLVLSERVWTEPPVIDDFNRANAALAAGAVWTGTVKDSATATVLAVASNVLSGQNLSTSNALSSITIGPDFDIILDVATGGTPNATQIEIGFAIQGQQSGVWTGYWFRLGSNGWWQVGKQPGGVITTDSSLGYLATGDRLRVSVRGTNINIYKAIAASPSDWTLMMTFQDTTFLPRIGRFYIYIADTVTKFDNLRAATVNIGGGPLNNTLIDDFNRADGVPSAGAGSTIWSPNKLINTGTNSAIVITSQALTCSFLDSVYNAVTHGPDVDYVFEVAAVLAANDYLDYFFSMTSPNSASYTGYAVRFDSSIARVYIARYDAGTRVQLAFASQAVPAIGDRYWIARRGPLIAVYWWQNQSWSWVPIVSYRDATYIRAGYFGISLGKSATIKLDSIRGGTVLGSGSQLQNKVIT